MKQLLKDHIFILLLLALLVIGWAAGLRLCSVESGSMEPAIPTGSLCVVTRRASYESIAVGDVVVYLRASDGKRIIHRVIQITDQGMVTRGDANGSDDGLSVTKDNLYAKNLFHVPYLGRLSMALRTPLGAILLAALVAGLAVWDAVSVRKEKTAGKQKKE